MKKIVRMIPVFAFALLVAPAAMAQFSGSVCQGASPTDMLDRNFAINNADSEKECRKLCKLQSDVCSRVADSQGRCWSAEFLGSINAERLTCDSRECARSMKQSAKSMGTVIREDSRDERMSCREFAAECMQGCAEPEPS